MNTNTSESTEEVETEAEAQEKKGGDAEVGIAAENVPLAVVEDGEAAGATEAAIDANSEAAAPSCGAEISEVKAQGEEEEEREAAVGEGGESEYAKRMASDLCVQSRKARWANRKAASKKAAAPMETVARPESPRPTSQNGEVASAAASALALSEESIERKLYSAVCKSPEPVAAAAPEEAMAEEPEEQPQPTEQLQQQQPPPPHSNGKARRRGNRGKNAAVQRQNSRSEPEAAAKGAAPLVDEDGWETKSNKRKGRKGASSRQNSIVGNGVAQQQQLRQRRQSSLEARDEDAARDDATEGTPAAGADEASVPSAAEAPSEAAGEQPQEPEAAQPEKEREEKEKERDGDGEESVKSEEATLQRRKKRNKKAYRQNTQPLELEQQHECCNLPRVYVQDGLPGTVGPLNTKVRPATELFDAATLTEVMQRRGGHLDTLFVQGIGCGIGVGPLTMGRIGGGGRGRYCPPDRAHEIPEKFREQPKEEGENGENGEGGGDDDKGKEEEEEKEEKQQRGEQEPEQPEEGQQPVEGQPPSVEIELD